MTPPLQVELRGEAATVALGTALGRVLERGDLVALDGDLGAGKTTLVRGLAAGVGADPQEVRSPTFVLAHIYRGGRISLGHLDAYRLGPGADLTPLGLDDLLDEGAVAVEWAQWAQLDAEPAATIRLEAVSPEARLATLGPAAGDRLAAAFAAAAAP
jgi:tRNA threonylcarbamoyl adenosine modification protein YjeE